MQELLSILCCPETHQTLQMADATLIAELNRKITSGEIKNRAGKSISEPIDSGFLRADGKYLYPVRSNIPVMLIDDAIPL